LDVAEAMGYSTIGFDLAAPDETEPQG
jgi:hypothetical protein